MNPTFKLKAPMLMMYLMETFGFSDFQAAGIAGNVGHESNGMTEMQEQHPIAGRGGLGWCQWTGPRRVEFESWCAGRAYNTDSDQANIGYLIHDLKGEYKATVAAVIKARTLEEACTAFERNYERAGVVAMQSRFHWATAALAAYKAANESKLGASNA